MIENRAEVLLESLAVDVIRADSPETAHLIENEVLGGPGIHCNFEERFGSH